MFPEMRVWCDVAVNVAAEHDDECYCDTCQFAFEVFMEAHEMSRM